VIDAVVAVNRSAAKMALIPRDASKRPARELALKEFQRDLKTYGESEYQRGWREALEEAGERFKAGATTPVYDMLRELRG